MDGTLALKKFDVLGRLDALEEGGGEEVTISIFDKYAFSIDQYASLVVAKTHMGETTTQTISHDSSTHNVDNKFNVIPHDGWDMVLLVDSTEYPAGTTWNWRYGFAPPISELTFVGETRTDTVENFLTELYNK